MNGENKVVLRYRDGRTERVDIAPIDQARQVFTIKRDDGRNTEVPYTDLKAVFFPLLEGGRPTEQPEGGMSVAVEFSDGEVIRGVGQYNPERNGFFLFPNDRSKHDRIFVVTSAVVSIEVERL